MFYYVQVVRHGFPYDPKCMDYDPIQKLLAIGNGSGSIRIFGQAGVDCHLKHESSASVLFVQFLVNEVWSLNCLILKNFFAYIFCHNEFFVNVILGQQKFNFLKICFVFREAWFLCAAMTAFIYGITARNVQKLCTVCSFKRKSKCPTCKYWFDLASTSLLFAMPSYEAF